MHTPYQIAGSAITNAKEFAAWLIATLICLIGFRFAKDIVVFAMEKIYGIIIEHKPL